MMRTPTLMATLSTENFLSVPCRSMQAPSRHNSHWGEVQYLHATGKAILKGRVLCDLTSKITRRDQRGGGSLLDPFAARAAVAKPVLCSDHRPVLLTLTVGSIEWASPQHAAPKGLCNIRYQVGSQEDMLAKLQAVQQTASPTDCAANAFGRVLARVSAAAMDTFQQRKRPCLLLMPPWADADNRQVKQRVVHACRHPMHVSVTELSSLQCQVQGMHEHKKRNHFWATDARLEAACRAGRQSFWTPFMVCKLLQCPVNAQAQLAYMQELHGTGLAPALVQLFPCELPAYRDLAPCSTTNKLTSLLLLVVVALLLLGPCPLRSLSASSSSTRCWLHGGHTPRCSRLDWPMHLTCRRPHFQACSTS